jgi:hypothetical protein
MLHAAKQVGTDLALPERRDEDAIGAAALELRQVGLAHGQRHAAQILAIERQDTESVEPYFIIMLLPECRALKSAMPSTPRMTASPSMTNCLTRFFSALSMIHG